MLAAHSSRMVIPCTIRAGTRDRQRSTPQLNRPTRTLLTVLYQHKYSSIRPSSWNLFADSHFYSIRDFNAPTPEPILIDPNKSKVSRAKLAQPDDVSIFPDSALKIP
jgi:hypothetical protein